MMLPVNRNDKNNQPSIGEVQQNINKLKRKNQNEFRRTQHKQEITWSVACRKEDQAKTVGFRYQIMSDRLLQLT
jgi:hypothetical protein